MCYLTRETFGVGDLVPKFKEGRLKHSTWGSTLSAAGARSRAHRFKTRWPKDHRRKNYKYLVKNDSGRFALFYGISTILGYLMPNPSFKNSSGSI